MDGPCGRDQLGLALHRAHDTTRHAGVVAVEMEAMGESSFLRKSRRCAFQATGGGIGIEKGRRVGEGGWACDNDGLRRGDESGKRWSRGDEPANRIGHV
jgi:hypothetical protein